MNNDKRFVIWFEDLTINDVPLVGGKNAALGEMIRTLTEKGVRVPGGFAVTAYAYNYFLEKAGLRQKIQDLLNKMDISRVSSLQKYGSEIRKLIIKANLPEDLVAEITSAYHKLEGRYKTGVDVAVRSSATAEDLPGASFAGQQETYLNVSGVKDVIEKTKHCFASLFTDRAISYRHDQKFDHMSAALSVSVQKMVRSDMATSGVMFSIDTETGYGGVVIIDAVYGLGELIVQGQVTPDEYIVAKVARRNKKQGIIAKDRGQKDKKMIYVKGGGGKVVPVSLAEQRSFALTDEEVVELADWAIIIEDHFSEHHGHYQPMDMEWAKDGESNLLYIVQARPETVVSRMDRSKYSEYKLSKTPEKLLLQGVAVGTKITTGKVRVIKNASQMKEFKEGEVLVTEITNPDWEPIMKIASAIVTDKGGRTSHAAIVSRELGIPCIVGSEKATKLLTNGMEITIDCSSGKAGKIYQGAWPFEKTDHEISVPENMRTKVMVNIGAPEEAFKHYLLPVKGVGLGRLEFIIGSHIGIHPRALIDFDKLKSDSKNKILVSKIEEKVSGYKSPTDYYINEIAEGVAKIATVFHPNDVIIRFSDFKTNEYRTLLGGDLYEPEEENPMIGWRGSSRYYHPDFKEAFGLECQALAKVRNTIGLPNVVPMIPFCRTIDEAKAVLSVMAEYGLDRQKDPSLKIYMMCEIPSNVMLADQFLDLFDGYSIGSNDLTQLVLGLDRDSGRVSGIANETNEAVVKMIEMVIKIANEKGKYIGICGQAPSDFPEFAKLLVSLGITSISLSPDTVLKTLPMIASAEQN